MRISAMGKTRAATMLMLAWCAGTCAMARSQPPAKTPPTSTPTGTNAPATTTPKTEPPAGGVDAATMKANLQRLLERLRQGQQRIEKAIGELDSGAAPADVRREIERTMRTMREQGFDGWGGPNGERPDGMPGEFGPGRGAGGAGGAGGPPGGGPDGNGPGGQGFGPQGTGGPGGNRRLTAEEREQVRGIFRESRPAILALIDEISNKNADASDRMIEGLGPRVRGLAELKEHDPELFNLKLDEIGAIFDVTRATRQHLKNLRANAPADQVAESRAKVREALAKQFDVHVKIQQHDVDGVLARAERIREDIQRQIADRDKIIDDRLDHATRPPQRGNRGARQGGQGNGPGGNGGAGNGGGHDGPPGGGPGSGGPPTGGSGPAGAGENGPPK